VPASAPAPPPPTTLQGIRDALADSPTGRAALEHLDNNHIAVDFQPGGGSYWDAPNNRMVIDSNENAEEVALTMVHEINHAQNVGPDIAATTRNDYVNQSIEEESVGTVRSIEAKNELVAAGGHPTATFPLENEYNTAYQQGADNLRNTNPAATPAQIDAAGKQAGLDRVRQGFNGGEVETSNTHEPYSTYYGNGWDGAHPAGP